MVKFELKDTKNNVVDILTSGKWDNCFSSELCSPSLSTCPCYIHKCTSEREKHTYRKLKAEYLKLNITAF